MIKSRNAADRGHVNHGWRQSAHTFSFGEYHNPTQMGFSVLRVINEDRVAAGAGFPPHSHQNMEIITYVIEGALEHKDSLGHSIILKAGDLQRMSAGRGVTHSEFNPAKNQATHFLQIWIFPDKEGCPPTYQQKNFTAQLKTEKVSLIASNHGRDGSVSLNQDVDIYALKALNPGEKILNTDATRSYWLQAIKGVVQMNDLTIKAGDALAAVNETRLHFRWQSDAEFLLFDLP